MKSLTTFVLILAITHLALCHPTSEEIINRLVKRILQKGVVDGVLPQGAYYLHHLKETSHPKPKLNQLRLHIRGLNNQTKLDLKLTADDDFNLKSWYYNYTIINGSKKLGGSQWIHWLDYAESSKSDYCPDLGGYEEASYLYGRHAPYGLPKENFNVTGSLKDLYELGMEKYGDFLLPADDFWKEPKFDLDYLRVTFEKNAYVLYYGWRQESYGDRIRVIEIYNVYQPCSGTMYSYSRPYDTADDDA